MLDEQSRRTAGRGMNWLWQSILVFAMVTFTLRFAVFANPLFSEDNVNRVVAGVLTSAISLLTVGLAYRFLNKRRWAELRFDSPRLGWKPLLFGMFCWLIPAGIGVIVFALIGLTEVTLHASIGETMLSAGQLLLIVFLSEALPEELVFRGYFYSILSSAMPQWWAILTQAALFTGFGAIVGAAGTIDRVVFLFAFGVVLGVFRSVTGSVWASIGFHLAYQTLTQLLSPGHSQISAVPFETLVAVVLTWFPFVVGWGAVGVYYGKSPSWRMREQYRG